MKIVYFDRTRNLGGKAELIWAKIILQEEEWEKSEVINDDAFIQARNQNGELLKIEGIPVLEQNYNNIISCSNDDDFINALGRALEKEFTHKLRVIFSATLETYYKVVKETEPDEFEPKCIATNARNILDYGICVEGLLVAFSDQE